MRISIKGALFVLYVANQETSTEFYRRVLAMEPSLHVPGMTEFTIHENFKLGLMPEKGIVKLLGTAIRNPEAATGIPRAETYLLVDDPAEFHQRALAHGATELSRLSARDWGDHAAYSLDPDGHVLVFAHKPVT